MNSILSFILLVVLFNHTFVMAQDTYHRVITGPLKAPPIDERAITENIEEDKELVYGYKDSHLIPIHLKIRAFYGMITSMSYNDALGYLSSTIGVSTLEAGQLISIAREATSMAGSEFENFNICNLAEKEDDSLIIERANAVDEARKSKLIESLAKIESEITHEFRIKIEEHLNERVGKKMIIDPRNLKDALNHGNTPLYARILINCAKIKSNSK